MRKEKEKMKPAGILHLMLFIILTSGLDAAPPGPDEELAFYNKWGDLDHSAVKTCRMLNGDIQAVTTQNLEKGYYCDYKASAWTGDKKQALEYCKSRTPYHINVAEPFDDGGFAKTRCQYQINMKCATDYFQIFNRCYKRVLAKFTYDEAKAYCAKEHPKMRSKLAQYYSDLLSLYFEHMNIGAAWVDVEDMAYYYDLTKEQENATGIYVQDDAWKFHVKPGTILMMPETDLYEALCEYQPPSTIAEMFTMAGIYKEVYPIVVTDTEALMVSPGYLTIDAKPVQYYQGQTKEKFTVTSMRDACNRMSAILNIDSYPLAAFEEMYDNVKDHLTAHRYYLTGAFKHDGCSLGDYRYLDYETGEEMIVVKNIVKKTNDNICDMFSYSLTRWMRLPTKAAMRAPIMCTFTHFKLVDDDCPAGWHQWDRSDVPDKKVLVCHWISTEHLGNKVFTFDDATSRCLNQNSLIAGFESVEELNSIYPAIMRGAREFADDNHRVDTHYYLSGVIPCVTNCIDGYKASWKEQVSRNSKMLNEYNHYAHPWQTYGNNMIALRGDVNALHTHNTPADYGGRMYFICTKYPTQSKIMIKNKGPK